MKKVNVLVSVQSSASSIFSKEDVINLINSIDEVKARVFTPNDLERAIDNVISWVENNERDLLDLDSAEIELNYNNKIEVVGVPINTEGLREALENNFNDFAEVEEEEEEFVRITDIVAENEL